MCGFKEFYNEDTGSGSDICACQVFKISDVCGENNSFEIMPSMKQCQPISSCKLQKQKLVVVRLDDI
jgi:hypothetical protein